MTELTVDKMPTSEEILAGDTQAGVPRPSFLHDDDHDGTVESVGNATQIAPAAPSPTDAATQVKLAQAEHDAATAALRAAERRLGAATMALTDAQGIFYNAVDREFLG